MAKDLLWLNGKISSIEEGRIPIEDRGFNFADGIYEVALFYNGRPFMIREHLERWDFSAKGLEINSPMKIDERIAMIMDLVAQSGYKDAMAYGQMTRGVSRRNHVFPGPDVQPTELWFVRPAPKHSPDLYANGVKLATHPDERWAQCQYKTICLLPNCLAKERARRVGGYEALLIAEGGIVTECSASNAFCVRDGVVYTHPLSPRILGGITRIAILEAARKAGLEVREEAVTLDQFLKADEAFISSTTMEVMPVTRVDDVEIGNGRVGEITRRIHHGFRERVDKECGTELAVV